MFWVSRVGVGTKDLGSLPLHYQGAEWEVNQPGLEPASIWDMGLAGGELAHHTAMRTPRRTDFTFWLMPQCPHRLRTGNSIQFCQVGNTNLSTWGSISCLLECVLAGRWIRSRGRAGSQVLPKGLQVSQHLTLFVPQCLPLGPSPKCHTGPVSWGFTAPGHRSVALSSGHRPRPSGPSQLLRNSIIYLAPALGSCARGPMVTWTRSLGFRMKR